MDDARMVVGQLPRGFRSRSTLEYLWALNAGDDDSQVRRHSLPHQGEWRTDHRAIQAPAVWPVEAGRHEIVGEAGRSLPVANSNPILLQTITFMIRTQTGTTL